MQKVKITTFNRVFFGQINLVDWLLTCIRSNTSKSILRSRSYKNNSKQSNAKAFFLLSTFPKNKFLYFHFYINSLSWVLKLLSSYHHAFLHFSNFKFLLVLSFKFLLCERRLVQASSVGFGVVPDWLKHERHVLWDRVLKLRFYYL